MIRQRPRAERARVGDANAQSPRQRAKRRPEEGFDPLDPVQLDARARVIIHRHFDAAARRVPAFLEKNYRSFDKVMWRNLRGVTDYGVGLWNAATWLPGKIKGRDYSTTTWTEDKRRSLFADELVQMKSLTRSLATLHKQLGRSVDARLFALRSSPRLTGKTPEEVEAMILRRLGNSNDLGDEVKVVVTKGAFAIASYLTAGKLKASLMPVGTAVAGSMFISQAGFFAGLWYSVVGVPAWVAFVGAAAGAGVAVLVAPVLGAVVEYGINHRDGLEERIRANLRVMRNLLLDGRDDGECHIESVIVRLLRQRDNAVRIVELVTRAVQTT